MLMQPRILVNIFVLVGVFRFGRAFLAQEAGEDDEHRHLEKLAFPVLGQGFPEMPGGEIFRRANGGLIVLPLLLVVVAQSRGDLAKQGEEKQCDQYN